MDVPDRVDPGSANGAVASANTVGGAVTYFAASNGTLAIAGAGGVLFLGPLLMILFRQKYPRWWFDWNLELQRFANRVGVYLALMDDRYPSTDDHQAVHLDYTYPDVDAGPEPLAAAGEVAAGHSRTTSCWRSSGSRHSWQSSSPGSPSCSPGAIREGCSTSWTGVFRWSNRVTGYAFTLVTDQYPPFRLSP